MQLNISTNETHLNAFSRSHAIRLFHVTRAHGKAKRCNLPLFTVPPDREREKKMNSEHFKRTYEQTK